MLEQTNLSTFPCQGISFNAIDQIASVETTQYFTTDEISNLLERWAFVENQENEVTDKWSHINFFRKLVSSALNKALLEILSPHVKEDYPIVEIGSGIGYDLPKNLSHQAIRIQPSLPECQLLKRAISDPVYQMNLEDFCHCLSEKRKKIPLFFALDVFDTMPPHERKANLSKISELQSTGDRILIMLDTNPLLEEIIDQLETQYPQHAALPYFSPGGESKLSFVMVPVHFLSFNPHQINMEKLLQRESANIELKGMSQLQYQLHQLQSTLNLKVIVLEDFFAEQVKNELEQLGYIPNIYYHAAFTTGDIPSEASSISQNLIYKSVTDTATIRQWSLEDENLIRKLAQKNLKLPSQICNEEFLQDLKANHQKVFGTEILVIEAIKT